MSAKKENDTANLSEDRSGARYQVLMRGQQYVVFRHSQSWSPPTDVMEKDDRLIVLVEIAGMRDAEFQVSISGQRLAITGTRATREHHCSAYHQLEVRYGEFLSEVNLPWPVDENGITAQYDDGYLRVELPRAKPEKVHVIAVNKSQDES
ncbi:MAG: Hsp20/alpha crystallin family protein [Anaerolineae bacterium]|nr:Hsp20/alpha crystallin family protein [Anaerolineae bacterium]